MKRSIALFPLIGTMALLLCAAPASAVTVTGTVVLDGVLDPFGNLDAVSRTYNFTDGLNFDPGGEVQIWDHTLHFREDQLAVADVPAHVGHKGPTLLPITFNFAPGTGGMNMGADGYIDIMTGTRNGGNDLLFNMNDNNITGTGSINSCLTDGSCGGGGGTPGTTGPPFGGTAGSMDVVIESDANVTLKEIIAGGADAGGGAVSIRAAGHVDIGTVSSRDPSAGGSSADPIDITASSMKLGALRSDSLRTGDGSTNGNINLIALAPDDYDPANGAGNSIANVIELNGLIDTRGGDTTQLRPGGDVNITAVKVILGPDFAADIAPFDGTLAIHVGDHGPGVFMDMSTVGGFSATGDVQYSGPVIPEPSTLILVVFGSLVWAASRRRIR